MLKEAKARLNNLSEKLGCCEKDWADLTVEEKIERARNEIHYLKNRNHELTRLVERLLQHDHLNNKMVMPVLRELEYERRDNPKYF